MPINKTIYLSFAIVFLVLMVGFIVYVIISKLRKEIKLMKKQIEVWGKTTYHISAAGDKAFQQLPLGIIVYDETYTIKWVNDFARNSFNVQLNEASLNIISTDLVTLCNSTDTEVLITFGDKKFEFTNDKENKVLYFFDVTQREDLKQQYHNKIVAMGLITIDNLEESLKRYDIEDKTTISGKILGEISQWAEEYGAFLQSIDEDRIFLVCDLYHLELMIEDKFSILNKVRDIAKEAHIRTTISIGMAAYDTTEIEVGKIALNAVELAEKLTEEGYFEGISVYQSYFNLDLENALDYLSDYILVFDEKSEIVSKYQFIEENYEKQLEENIKTELIYSLRDVNHINYNDFVAKFIRYQRVDLNNFIDSEFDEIIDFNAQVIKNFNANMDEVAEYIKNHEGYQIIIATDYKERVKEILASYDIYNVDYANNISANGTIIEDAKLILLTDRELFNKRNKEVTSTKRTSYKEKAEYIESINDIKEGEYVVHSVHGVGIYIGLTQQELDGQLKDYLTIEYAQKDRLHIPAEQINLLCRYRGAGAAKPKLSRMGGSDWEKTKSKVKQEVEKVAYDLLRLYARRKIQEGIAFDPDTAWQLEMEDAFEYTETPDQMKAINEIKSDMESINPMDRLVCGDVGFGKTEVAMRGIFKAVASGKQVAVIVPTTILALQHYQTISERFKPYGVNVELLCRFISDSGFNA